MAALVKEAQGPFLTRVNTSQSWEKQSMLPVKLSSVASGTAGSRVDKGFLPDMCVYHVLRNPFVAFSEGRSALCIWVRVQV